MSRLNEANVILAREIIGRYPKARSATIPLLHLSQQQNGYVTNEAIAHVAELVGATSAEHGGNMDYNGFVSGVTVYFPVAVPGALFFLGDGHAVQVVLGQIVECDALRLAPQGKGAFKSRPTGGGVFFRHDFGAGVIHVRIARL